MLNRIDGFFIETISATGALQALTIPPLPPGTNVYTTICLSFLNTLFEGNAPDPKYTASAFIDSWTVYQTRNAVGAAARIGVHAERTGS
jgi:hypothetical protein